MKTIKHSAMAMVLSLSAACASDDPEGVQAVDDFEGGSQELTFGVVSSDFTAASVSLLNADGSMLSKDFIHSGSAPTGLVTALSGDLALPTRSGESDTLVIIDRFRTDVVTRVDPQSGEVLGQVKTQAPNDENTEAAFSSNPQDYVRLDDSTAWVSRFGPNTAVAQDDQDRGNDLLQINPSSFERGERIALSQFNTEGERSNPDTGETETVPVFARPSALARLGDHMVVGLARLSDTFDAIGDGMVAVVNLNDSSVAGLAIPGLQNCASVTQIPGDDTLVAVACAGFYRGDQEATSGLAILQLQDGEFSIRDLWSGADRDDDALTNSGLIALGGDEVVAIATGVPPLTDESGNVTSEGSNDAAYLVNVATGEQTLLFEADGQFVLGSGAFNPANGTLLVPDASVDSDGRPTAGVRRLQRNSDGSFEALEVIRVHEILPPRQVRAL